MRPCRILWGWCWRHRRPVTVWVPPRRFCAAWSAWAFLHPAEAGRIPARRIRVCRLGAWALKWELYQRRDLWISVSRHDRARVTLMSWRLARAARQWRWWLS